jgi:hypothetical protein
VEGGFLGSGTLENYKLVDKVACEMQEVEDAKQKSGHQVDYGASDTRRYWNSHV